MHKPKSVLALLVCFVGCIATVYADDSALQTVLQGRYAAMKVAMSTHNDKAVSALLAPDFVGIDVSGQSEDTAQMIQEVDSLPRDPNRISTTTIVSVKPANDSAVVSRRYDMKTVKTAADGSKQNVELVTLSTDTWIDASGTWLLQKTETDQIDYYVDGQRVMHKVRAL